METDEAARHFVRALIDAGRERAFILDLMAAYYGEIGQAVALDVLSESSEEGSTGHHSDIPTERVAEYIALGRRS
jgi:hypothetical protein